MASRRSALLAATAAERELEFSLSARCALQYVTGLVVHEPTNLAIVSYGELDCRMRVAALPLDGLLELVRTHTINEDKTTTSECAPFGY